jgi:hypothetical protein
MANSATHQNVTESLTTCSLFKMSFFGAASSPTVTPPDKDIEVADPPGDSISSLSFSSQADYVAVGSWDNNVGRSISITKQ